MSTARQANVLPPRFDAPRDGESAPCFTRDELVRDLRLLGVRPGDLLCVEASLKSVGRVEGGADALLEALLEAVGPAGTVVTLSFVDVSRLPLRDVRTGLVTSRFTRSYVGSLANAIVRYPDARRSTHPIQMFAAIGARAGELMDMHNPDSYGYDVMRVLTEEGGLSLEIGSDEKTVGVGTTYVAIGMLGLKQKRPWRGVQYLGSDGRLALFERDWASDCSEGFINFGPHYRRAGAVLRDGKVGLADSRIIDMKRALEVELDLLRRSPSFFLCRDAACVSCRLTWEFSTGSVTAVLLANLRRRRFSAVRTLLEALLSRNPLSRGPDPKPAEQALPGSVATGSRLSA